MAGESKDKARLLIVEDDEALAALMLEYLGMHWFELSHVTSGNAGVEAMKDWQAFNAWRNSGTPNCNPIYSVIEICPSKDSNGSG